MARELEPLDNPVTHMTRPAKGPAVAVPGAPAPASAIAMEAGDVKLEGLGVLRGGEEGGGEPGGTMKSLEHPLLLITSTRPPLAIS